MDGNYLLSDNFKLKEFTKSQTAMRRGIKNIPTGTHLDNLQALCQELLQPVRKLVRRPVIVTSGYRSKELNNVLRGASNSQHSKGEAVDFYTTAHTSTEICQMIIDSGLEFDQLIDEGDWVHLSYTQHSKNRKEVLTADFSGKKVKYHKGLTRGE